MKSILFVMIFISAGFSLASEGELVFGEGKKTIKLETGYTTQAVLRINPSNKKISMNDLSPSKKMDIPNFFIADIKSITQNENNPEIIEVKLLLTLLQKLANLDPFEVNINGKKIKVEPKNIKVEGGDVEIPREFGILEQDFLNPSHKKTIILSLFITLALLSAWGGREMMKKNKVKKSKENFFYNELNQVRSLIQNVQTRKQFEEIFSKKKLIKKYLVTESREFNNFLNLVDENQYREMWSEEIFDRVMEHYKKVSFNFKGFKS